MERISIFIDGNNFYFGLKRIYKKDKNLIDFSFQKFCNLITKGREIQDIFYYNAPLDRTKDLEGYKRQQKFFEKLKKIPKFNLILCKLLKRKIKETGKYFYVLKEDDIHMAGDMIKGAFRNSYDSAILVSGDGDFVPAVKIVQEEGKKVENIYFKKSASTNLKQHCDKSIRLTKELLDKCFDEDKLPLTRDQALELLEKYNPKENKQDWNHYLESEAIMKALAEKLGEDVEYWGMLGLLHDVDWGVTKENTIEHLTKAPLILREAGFDDKFINNIISHGCGFECAGLKDKKRSGKVEHALAACETLTGLIHAYALMRGGRVSDMEVKGLKKKFKDKTFAAGCNRDIIREIEEVELGLDEFFEIAIGAVKGIKEGVGLE